MIPSLFDMFINARPKCISVMTFELLWFFFLPFYATMLSILFANTPINQLHVLEINSQKIFGGSLVTLVVAFNFLP